MLESALAVQVRPGHQHEPASSDRLPRAELLGASAASREGALVAVRLYIVPDGEARFRGGGGISFLRNLRSLLGPGTKVLPPTTSPSLA